MCSVVKEGGGGGDGGEKDRTWKLRAKRKKVVAVLPAYTAIDGYGVAGLGPQFILISF